MRYLLAFVALCAIGVFAAFVVVRDDDHWRDGDPRHASRGAFRGAVIALMACCIAMGIVFCSAVFAHARPSPVTSFDGDRYSARQAAPANPAKARHAAHRRAPVARKSWTRVPVPKPRRVTAEPYRADTGLSLGGGIGREVARVLGGRPAGCPSRFCGCGASIHLFGRIIPSLNLAANWLRFPRASPAPGMVAARRGHVFVLKAHIAGNKWLVHDSNSGRGRTRIHPRSIAGYAIVNPHGSS